MPNLRYVASGGSTLEQGCNCIPSPYFLVLHPQFGMMQQKLSPWIKLLCCVDQNRIFACSVTDDA